MSSTQRVVVTGMGVASTTDDADVAAASRTRVAARRAFDDAGLARRRAVTDPWLVAVETTREERETSAASAIAHAIADELGLASWQPLVLATARASGSQAIGYGADLIITGDVEFAICGGGDALLVLESKYRAHQRRARVHAEIYGHALTFDPVDGAPDTEDGPTRCVRAAHARAAVTPDEIGLVLSTTTGPAPRVEREVAAAGCVAAVDAVRNRSARDGAAFVVQSTSREPDGGNAVVIVGTMRPSPSPGS